MSDDESQNRLLKVPAHNPDWDVHIGVEFDPNKFLGELSEKPEELLEDGRRQKKLEIVDKDRLPVGACVLLTQSQYGTGSIKIGAFIQLRKEDYEIYIKKGAMMTYIIEYRSSSTCTKLTTCLGQMRNKGDITDYGFPRALELSTLPNIDKVRLSIYENKKM